MSKWLSRKFFIVQQGLVSAVGVPVVFKYFEIGESVTLAALGLVTLILGYYLKVNKDLKVESGNNNGQS